MTKTSQAHPKKNLNIYPNMHLCIGMNELHNSIFKRNPFKPLKETLEQRYYY